MAKRRTYSADFKARVAQEAMRSDRTAQQVATNHGVHPSQVSQWKREANERLVELFERRASAEQDAHEAEFRRLRRKVGQLELERDFLQSVWEGATEPAAGEAGSARPDLEKRTRSD